MRLTLLSFCLMLSSFLFAQTSLEVNPNDLYVAGDTRSLGNNCYRLTTAQWWEAGSVWFDPTISLKEPFEMEMNILFGCQDEMGADGLVFIFHTEKIPAGYKGEGMGFGGLVPSLGIEIDTYQNFHLADPEEDHVAVMAHGQVSHYASLQEPVKIPNVEDCKEHLFRINWEPKKKLLTVMLDGKNVVDYEIDLSKEIFRGKTELYWGVSAATGKKTNLHEICFKQLTFNEPALGYSTKRDLLDGNIVDLKAIQFPQRINKLNTEATKELDKLVLFLKDNPKHKLQLYVHSNEGGGSESEKTKTTQRAEALRRYLEAQGIDKDRLTFQPMGKQFAKKPGTEVERLGNWVSAYLFIPRV